MKRSSEDLIAELTANLAPVKDIREGAKAGTVAAQDKDEKDA